MRNWLELYRRCFLLLQGMLQDLQISDSAECKFSLNSFHLQFTAGKECVVFRLGSLQRARDVSWNTRVNGMFLVAKSIAEIFGV